MMINSQGTAVLPREDNSLKHECYFQRQRFCFQIL